MHFACISVLCNSSIHPLGKVLCRAKVLNFDAIQFVHLPFMHHAFQRQWKNALSSPWSQRFLFLKMLEFNEVKWRESCSAMSTLCNPTDCAVHGILQERILEWVTLPFSNRSSQPRDWTQVSRIAGGFFAIWATREAVWSLLSWFLVSMFWGRWGYSQLLWHLCWKGCVSCAELLLHLRETPLATFTESVSSSLSRFLGLCVCPHASITQSCSL